MTDRTIEHIREHAAQCFPLESCGLIVVKRGRESYWPCRNIATGADHFQMHAEDYAAAEDAGDVLKIVHSHPNIAPLPSQADLVACELTGLPWVIVNWPTGQLHEFAPTQYKAPLIGRVFMHGVLDCYTLVRDYYQERLGLTLPDFDRHGNWWVSGQDLYRDNYTKAGFFRVPAEELREHDLILMQMGSDTTNPRHIPNHGAIYLGQGVILHHPMNRLSGRDQFGGFWEKSATYYLHHKDVP